MKINTYVSKLRKYRWVSNHIWTSPNNSQFIDIGLKEEKIYIDKFNFFLKQNSNRRGQRVTLGILKNYFEGNLLADFEFDWIDEKDTRLCYWLWGQLIIMHSVITAEGNIYTEYNNTYLPTARYDVAKQQSYPTPTNNNERRQTFITLFDNLTINLEQKKILMEKLKIDWSQIFLASPSLEWIDKNNEAQVKWAWTYLQGIDATLLFLRPGTIQELYGAIICSIDNYQQKDSQDIKASLIDKMKKAWMQKNRRNENVNKIQLNNGSISKLNILAEHNNQKIKKYLEQMITKEHEDLKNDILTTTM